MSRSASVTLNWGDGRQSFRLGIAELDELDDLCKVGPGHLLGQVNLGVYGPWKARAVRETLRLGLIGGGMAPTRAAQMVERYFDRGPIGDHLVTVQAVLLAAVVGDEEDAPGESKGEASRPFQTVESGSDPSMRSPAPSASRTSESSASGSSTGSTPAGVAPTFPTKRRRKGSATPSSTV